MKTEKARKKVKKGDDKGAGREKTLNGKAGKY